MTKVQRKKMLRLAEFLKTVPNKEFDMNWWIGEVPDFSNDGDKPEKVSINCGTTACAYGWGSAIFRNLRFDHKGHPNISPEEFFGIDADETHFLFGAHGHRTPKRQARIMEKFVAKKELEAA